MAFLQVNAAPACLLQGSKKIICFAPAVRNWTASFCRRNYFFTKTLPMKSQSDFIPSVTKPYNSWSDKKLAAETIKIQTAMTDNPDFPTPVPSVADYSSAVGAFILQLGKAGSRDVNAVAAKNARRKELINSTITLGTSVSLTANGDLEKLLSTALPLRKQAQPVVLAKPGNFRCTNGINPGELDLKVDTMDGVASFNFTYTVYPPTETSAWTTVTISKSSCTITGLESGKKYWFRVAAVGSKGQMVWGETLQSPYVQ